MKNEKIQKEIAKFNENPQEYVSSRPVRMKLWEVLALVGAAFVVGALIF